MTYIKALVKILNHPLNTDRKIFTLFKVCLWKLNQLTLRRPWIVNLNYGIKCICYPNSSFGGLVIYTRLPEYDEMKFVYEYLKEDDNFIDVGANIGVYSLIASSKIIEGKIYAFEPSKSALEILNQNIKLNNLEGKVKVVDKVVSDKNGVENFVRGEFSEVDHIVYKKGDNAGKKVKIESVTLDSFLKDEEVKYVDLVKIDVEGAELKVLRGLKDYLRKGHVGVVLFEVNKKSRLLGVTSQDLVLFLEKKGYIIYEFKDGKLVLLDANNLEERETFNCLAVYNSAKVMKRMKK